MGVEDHAASAAEVAEAAVSEAEIAVQWREKEYYPPPPSFVAQANAADPAIVERFSEDHYPGLLYRVRGDADVGSQVDTILDASNPPFWKWWAGGRLNASVNCVDRHLESRADKSALIWVPEREEEETQEITYQELYPTGERVRGTVA